MEEDLGLSFDPWLLNGLTLAYIGDAVFELMARTHALETGSRRADKLHNRVVSLVNAVSQAGMARGIVSRLDEREEAIYKRGRNTSLANIPRHASQAEYRRATGLEAVFGYLYLSGSHERMKELFLLCLDIASEGDQDTAKM